MVFCICVVGCDCGGFDPCSPAIPCLFRPLSACCPRYYATSAADLPPPHGIISSDETFFGGSESLRSPLAFPLYSRRFIHMTPSFLVAVGVQQNRSSKVSLRLPLTCTIRLSAFAPCMVWSSFPRASLRTYPLDQKTQRVGTMGHQIGDGNLESFGQKHYLPISDPAHLSFDARYNTASNIPADDLTFRRQVRLRPFPRIAISCNRRTNYVSCVTIYGHGWSLISKPQSYPFSLTAMSGIPDNL